MIHLGKVVQIANRLGCPKGESNVNRTRTVLFAKALVQWDVNKPPARPPERVSSH